MPDWKTIVRERLIALRLNPGAEADLAEEVAQHLEDKFRELQSGGAGEIEAYEATVAQIEDLVSLRTGYRSERMPRTEPPGVGEPERGAFLEMVWKDVRFAFRTMRNNPLFVALVVITLAVGLGANTTVFTIVNTLIWNPLPVRDAASLAGVAAAEGRSGQKAAPLPLSYADLKDYKSRNRVFQSLAGYTSVRVVTRLTNGGSERMFAELTTNDYFSTLGVTPARGRFFLPDEENAPLAVLNYGTWQRRFGGEPDIVGSPLRINNVLLTIVGIAPPKFIGVNAIFGPDIWIPAGMSEKLLPTEMKNATTDRSKMAFLSVGRLKPGVTRAQAQADIGGIAVGLAAEFPAADDGRTAVAIPLSDVLFGSTSWQSVAFAAMALFAVVGMVLLIACSNVANLLLARSAARRQEIAVRLAMGASRGRLVRQLLTESVLLGLLSGGVGVAMAYMGLKALFGMLPNAANFIAPRMDGPVLAFALAISLATGFLFGTIPAWKASRADVAEALKEEGRTVGRSRRRVTIANALLTAQVAFSFLLLVTAMLFVRSIQKAYAMDPGFQTDHLALFLLNPGNDGYGKAQAIAFYKDARERVARLPGVASAAWSSNLPLWARTVSGVEVEGRETRSRNDKLRAVVTTIDPGYFETAGVRLEAGRNFNDSDRPGSLPVAIVNEKMVRDYWPGGALGRRIRLPGEEQMRQVVGIARTANYTTWGEAPQSCIYVPMEQNYSEAMTLFVRSKGKPAEVLPSVEREIRLAGPTLLLADKRTGKEIVDGGLFQAKAGVSLLSVFGLLALGLASIGLYGILAYSVQSRRREIGVRMAMGATQMSVVKLILREGMSLVAVGMAIGLAGAEAAGTILSRLLYGVNASDPGSIAAAAGLLAAVALVACSLPARNATRVDPLEALRDA